MKRLERRGFRGPIASLFMLLAGVGLLLLPHLGTDRSAAMGALGGILSPSEITAQEALGDEPRPEAGQEGAAAGGTPEDSAVEEPVEGLAVEGLAVARPEGAPRILMAPLDGVVSPGSAGYLIDAVAAATAGQYQALLVLMDTPGGLLESTREISRAFLESETPVIVFVYPTGARAASAGMFITMSAHVAAMAPGTRIGAAAPVAMGGGDDEGSTMDMKVVEDTAAFARSVAGQTGRNADWAERAVREAVSATASEALELNAVDLIAANVGDLLQIIDGRQIRLHDGTEVTLRAQDAELVEHPMTIQQRVMMVLGNPNVAYVLMMLGMLGLMMELYNPGLIFPAAVGIFMLLLAGIGLNLLPVNVGGVILIVVGVGLIVAEIFFTAYGVLALVGVGIMVLGSALMMNTADPDFFVEPDLAVSWGVILPTVILIAAVAIGLMLYILSVHRRKATTGFEGMVGEVGKARGDIGPIGGRAFVHGEIWRAFSEEEIPAGSPIKVVGMQGLELQVAKMITE